MSQYYFRIHGVNFGPVSLEWLQREFDSGQLSGAEVRTADETNWTPVADVVEQGLTDYTPTTQSGPTSEPVEVEIETMWYVRMGRAEHGPIAFQKLMELATAGRILPIDRVRQSDQTEWTIAQAIPFLFSSNSSSISGGSSFSSRPTPSRHSQADPMNRGHAPQGATSPPVTTAPVQHAVQLPLQPSAETATNSQTKDSAHPQRSVLQTLNSGSELTVESTRQSIPQESSPGNRELGRNAGVDQSPKQPKSGPYPKFKGEIKPKPRTRQVGDPQPLFSWNLILAAAGCVLIIFIGRSLIPAVVGQFESPLAELSAAYQALDKDRSENPNGEVRAVATKEFLDKLESTQQRVKNLSTEHPIRLVLLTLSDNLIWAAKSKTDEELTTDMEVSRHLLDFATQEMQKWKDDAERKRSLR